MQSKIISPKTDTLKTPTVTHSSKASTVLIVNESHTAALQVTREIEQRLPGATILYAPGIQLANWIIMRRSIDLLVTSTHLPDGPFITLLDSLKKIESSPELVVVGEVSVAHAEALEQGGYCFKTLRQVGSLPSAPEKNQAAQVAQDLRHELNNPLQQIVAMVFVAQQTQGFSETTSEALHAIEQAASSMAKVVEDLEDKVGNSMR